MSVLILSDGPAVLCEGGAIAGLGDEVGRPAGARILRGGTVVPGRVCAHTHLYSGLVPLGMPDPEPPPASFLQILERVWWRLDRALDAASLRAAARLYVGEALLAGTTTLVDHHESPGFIEGSLDVLAEACTELGVRALLCYGATERNGGAAEAAAGLEACRALLRRSGGRVRGVVGLHASFTVSDDTIVRAGELCRDAGTVLHVHVAEDAADLRDAEERGWEGPLERLIALDALPGGSILAHGVHLGRDQVARAADRGAWFVHNPRSNRGNEVGWAGALAATDRVALGTDGYPADLRVEVAEGQAEAVAHDDDPALLPARLHAGRRLIAERFGQSFELERGATADLVVEVDGAVRDVVVDGRIVVRDGALVHADREELRAEAREQARRLWRRMEAL